MTSPPPNTTAPPAASTSSRKELEARVKLLENRLEALEIFLPSMPDSERLPPARSLELAAAVHDLAAQQRLLRRDLETILEMLDRSGNPPRGPESSISKPARNAASIRQLPPIGRRAARWLLRNTLGRARAAWSSADPSQPPVLDIRCNGPEVEVPGPLGLVVADPGNLDGDLFDRQTLPPQIVPQGATPESMAKKPSGARARSYHLLEAPAADFTMPHTCWELVSWALASEDLGFLELRLAAGQRILLRATQKKNGRSGNEVGKRLSFPRETNQRSLGPVLSSQYRPTERPEYYLRRNHRGAGHHLIGSLRAAESPAPEPPGRELLLLDTPLTRGACEWCVDWMRAHGGARRWIVVSRVASDELQSRRLASFESLGTLYYPIADFLAPPVLGSALPCIARTYSVSAVTRLGSGPWPVSDRELLAEHISCETHSSPVLRSWDLSDPPQLPMQRPCVLSSLGPEARETFRQRLGLADDQVLVVQICDLENHQRPADFLLLAHSLRRDPRFFFLLVGEGSTEPTLEDLEGYLRLPRYLRLPSAPRQALVSAGDLFTSTAELLPLPYDLLAAMAAGRPVVAAAAAGLEQRLGSPDHGILQAVGDLDGFAGFLCRVAAADARQLWGRAARKHVQHEGFDAAWRSATTTCPEDRQAEALSRLISSQEVD